MCIARIFNLTSASARALLRATMSRHRNRLKDVMVATAHRFIAAPRNKTVSGKLGAPMQSSLKC